MAITCPGCGREYDVTLFQYGRTIDCACGRRVGHAHRIETPVDATGAPRFIADAMLGGLARWLRSLGYDTVHDPHIADADLVRRAFMEERRILTRDRRLFAEWRIKGGLLIDAAQPLEQLREVVSTLGLRRPARLFTRCRSCNALLRPVARDAVGERVPPDVLQRKAELVECPDCGSVYWEGSHTERMRKALDQVFGRRTDRAEGAT